MASAQHALSAKTSHIETLMARHSAIEHKLHELKRHPSVSDFEIVKLKQQKLRLKEKIQSQ